MGKRFERSLAVFGAVAVIVVGVDGVTYAATGSSLILGLHNTERTPTFISNTGAGAPLALVARSTVYPPFATNAKGLVANLYSARAANADKVGGLTAAQVEAGATRLNGLTAAQVEAAAQIPWLTFNRTNAVPAAVTVNGGSAFPLVRSNAGATPSTYRLTGTVTFPCDPNAATDGLVGYYLNIVTFDTASPPNMTVLFGGTLSKTSCGAPMALPATNATLGSGDTIGIQVYGNDFSFTPFYTPATVSVAVSGSPAHATL